MRKAYIVLVDTTDKRTQDQSGNPRDAQGQEIGRQMNHSFGDRARVYHAADGYDTPSHITQGWVPYYQMEEVLFDPVLHDGEAPAGYVPRYKDPAKGHQG